MSDTNFIRLISDELERKGLEMEQMPSQVGLFVVRSVNRCLKDAHEQPIPRDLFYLLIFEGELTILFADTNQGKSILAIQIAEHIARMGIKVLVFDFELSDKQLEKRYSDNYENHYQFSENLFRISFADNVTVPQGSTYDDYFLECLRSTVLSSGAKVVIIDNMTQLTYADTDSAKSAKPLMDRLNAMKKELGLTMILLEHTRKVDSSRPISINDLQGSKMKVNFADAVIAIGKSHKSPSLKYIKQLKVRSCELMYHIDNVIECEIVKESNFLKFDFWGYGSEMEHLKQPDEGERNSKISEAEQLRERGLSNRAIAKELSVSEGTIRLWFKNA